MGGGGISLFSILANNIILDYWGILCKYKSCLTKYFTVDFNDGTLYACKNKINPLGNIFEFNNVDDIFQSKQFVKLLQKAIIKRNNCKNHCEFFDICKGGCLNDEECKEKKFFSVYKEIETKLRDIIQNEDFSKLNPELSKIILSGAASNKLFEKGLYK